MAKTAVDLTEDRLFSLGWALLNKAVCAPASWDAQRVADIATSEDPPGTEANRWELSDPSENFGGPFKGCNCIQCPDDPNRRHWLLSC